MERDHTSASAVQSDNEPNDSEAVHSVRAVRLATGEHVNLCYRIEQACGYGSFGEVNRVRILNDDTDESGQVYALKRTKQDRRFKNRELSLMQSRTLQHPNIIHCSYAWQERSDPHDSNQITLYLLLEFVPTTLFTHYRLWAKKGLVFPESLCKVYLFQLLRALAWCHALGVCHRDIKPQNILIEQDFGSAKVLQAGDENVTYTCSRYYRSPELIFGNAHYDHSIDVWSVGCVFAELLGGKVFFAGGTGIDQLVEIIKVLGTPSRSEIRAMNPTYQAHKFPQIPSVPLSEVLPHASPEAISLLYGFLRYVPKTRLTASEAMCHPFFDEIKQGEELLLPNGNKVDLNKLFLFSPEELSIRSDLNTQIIPAHFHRKLYEQTGVDLKDFRPLNLAHLHIDVD
ncbi:GSK family serine/threonine-protein kinase [Sporobolomyces salmoneus]|uniref:GSK family serine/threonine-protein kinase n=1 Tax=Sporobolomyces salmoneus TaxID=183962 RepID=UPI003175319A